MTTEAVIVSTARTAVSKAYRGSLNNTEGPTLAGHVMAEAVKRAGIAPGEVEDVVMGCAMQQGTMVMNVARKGAIRAGMPVTVAGTTIDRQCASGLQAIAVAARSVMLDGVDIAIGGGIESISLVQNEHMNKFHMVDDELMAMKPDMYMSMLDTAEIVAEPTRSAATNRMNIVWRASVASELLCRAAGSTMKSFPSPQRWRSSIRRPSRSPMNR